MKAPRYEAAAQRNIEEQASWLSYALMWYANPVLRLGASRRLEERDRVALAAVDDPARVRAAFEAQTSTPSGATTTTRSPRRCGRPGARSSTAI